MFSNVRSQTHPHINTFHTAIDAERDNFVVEQFDLYNRYTSMCTILNFQYSLQSIVLVLPLRPVAARADREHNRIAVCEMRHGWCWHFPLRLPRNDVSIDERRFAF